MRKGPTSVSRLRTTRLLTQLSLVRNLSGMPFPARMSDKMLHAMGDRLAERIIEVAGAEDVTDDTELALIGETLYGILPASERKPGYHLLRLPQSTERLAFWCEVMCSNHLTFSVSGHYLDSEEPHQMLAELVRDVEKKIPFAYDENLGYVTAQLSLIGAGLRIRSWLHLAGLTHFNYLQELVNAAEAAGILVEMEEGNAPPPGCIFILFNQHTLGRSARDIVSGFDRFLVQVVKQESLARERLALDETYLLLDRLVRAQAILGASLMMCEAETLDVLSDLRLGADVGALTKCKMNPLAEDWFEMMHDEVFCVRFSTLLEDRLLLPAQVMDSPQWRLDAYRATALRLFAEYDISKKFLKRALPV